MSCAATVRPLGGAEALASAPAAGYVLVDALVALLLLSMAFAVSLRAGVLARNAAAQAWETRRAETLLRQILDAGPRQYVGVTGSTDGFDWSLTTQATGAERPIAICRRDVELRSARSRRAYGAATLETCPPTGAP